MSAFSNLSSAFILFYVIALHHLTSKNIKSSFSPIPLSFLLPHSPSSSSFNSPTHSFSTPLSLIGEKAIECRLFIVPIGCEKSYDSIVLEAHLNQARYLLWLLREKINEHLSSAWEWNSRLMLCHVEIVFYCM